MTVRGAGTMGELGRIADGDRIALGSEDLTWVISCPPAVAFGA